MFVVKRLYHTKKHTTKIGVNNRSGYTKSNHRSIKLKAVFHRSIKFKAVFHRSPQIIYFYLFIFDCAECAVRGRVRSTRPSICVGDDDRVVWVDGPCAEGERCPAQPHELVRTCSLYPSRCRWGHLTAKHILRLYYSTLRGRDASFMGAFEGRSRNNASRPPMQCGLLVQFCVCPSSRARRMCMTEP